MKRKNPNQRVRGKPARPERTHHILACLHNQPEVYVSVLAAELRVDAATIRADIDWMAEAGVVKKFHGGAKTAGAQGVYQGLYKTKTLHCAAEKDRIASYAVAHHIRDADSLLLDSGSQLESFVQQLRHYPRSGIRAITQAANFAMYFLSCPDSEYCQLGGLLHSRSLLFADSNERFATDGFFDTEVDNFLRQHCATSKYKAVVTATGFTCAKGVASNSEPAIKYKQRIINAASEVLFLVDHSKFGVEARKSVTYCGLRAEEGDWLEAPTKPALVIVDWDCKDRPAELEQFAHAKGVETVPLPHDVQREYPGIRVFRTELFKEGGKDKVKPPTRLA